MKESNDINAALLAVAHDGDIAEDSVAFSAGANIDVSNHYHVMPLTEGIGQKRLKMARWLLKRGADHNYAGMSEGSPLMLAAYSG